MAAGRTGDGRRTILVMSALGIAGVVGSVGLAVARNDDGAKTFFLSAGLRETVEAIAPILTVHRDAPAVGAASRRRPPIVLAARPKRRPLPVIAALVPRDKAAALLAAEPTYGAVTPDAIYRDRTLKVGDAVMTAAGLRIFRGSTNFPYRDGDFVTVASAAALTRVDGKVVAALDSERKG